MNKNRICPYRSKIYKNRELVFTGQKRNAFSYSKYKLELKSSRYLLQNSFVSPFPAILSYDDYVLNSKLRDFVEN